MGQDDYPWQVHLSHSERMARQAHKNAMDHKAEQRRKADSALWRTGDGRELNVVDMETSHLINCAAMIARARLRRQHGVRVEGDLTADDAVLKAKFRLIMRELDERARRKAVQP